MILNPTTVCNLGSVQLIWQPYLLWLPAFENCMKRRLQTPTWQALVVLNETPVAF
jgi:hypothetical protein